MHVYHWLAPYLPTLETSALEARVGFTRGTLLRCSLGGAPFLTKHCIDVHVALTPALLCHSSTSPNVTLDLLASCSGTPTLAAARKTMSSWEVSQSEWTEWEGARTVILMRVAELERDEEKEERRKEEKECHEHLEELALLDHEMQREFPDLFPLELPLVVETTSTTCHHLKLINPTLVHNQRGYVPPCRYPLSPGAAYSISTSPQDSFNCPPHLSARQHSSFPRRIQWSFLTGSMTTASSTPTLSRIACSSLSRTKFSNPARSKDLGEDRHD
jgi:hypothetical protein